MRNRAQRWLSLLVPLALLCGCGSGDSGGPTNICSLTTSLAGGITRDVRHDDTNGCGGGHNEASRQRVLAYGGLGTLLVRVVALENDESDTGTFQARVELMDEMDREWATSDGDCEVVISRNDAVQDGALSNARKIEGTASCTSDALPVNGNTSTEPVSIADIVFYSCVLC